MAKRYRVTGTTKSSGYGDYGWKPVVIGVFDDPLDAFRAFDDAPQTYPKARNLLVQESTGRTGPGGWKKMQRQTETA